MEKNIFCYLGMSKVVYIILFGDDLGDAVLK